MGVGEEVRLAGQGVSVQFTKMRGKRKEQCEGVLVGKGGLGTRSKSWGRLGLEVRLGSQCHHGISRHVTG